MDNILLLDSVQIIILVCFAILVIAFFVALPRTKVKENLIVYPRVFIQLLIGLFILLPNFGQNWETGALETRTPYKAGCGQNINASLGINIGIRSINVTLKANSPTEGCLNYEIINYNERFHWSCDQTKSLQNEITAAKHRGIPKPIIWVMGYFTATEIDFQHGKFYCIAGWYCQICMWGAFIFYVVAIIMFRTILSYGIFCVTLSLVFIFMECKFERTLYMLFGVDPVNCYDEVVYLSKRECLRLRSKKSYESIPLDDLEETSQEGDSDYAAIYYRRGPLALKSKVTK